MLSLRQYVGQTVRIRHRGEKCWRFYYVDSCAVKGSTLILQGFDDLGDKQKKYETPINEESEIVIVKVPE